MEINPLHGSHSVTQDVVSTEHASNQVQTVKAPESVKELTPELSQDSQLMNTATHELSQLPDVDMTVIKSIRQQLESGELPIHYGELAKAISDFHFRGEKD
ncbi:flagellar biosynthesis anti-sigma factor FlgM [Paraferrimonas sp. SM1919]|uniref:flagellar biosynthesis anti-sigma factor FlgM n=1 Tax=Paraferrimonas sp. SM1919 TaxID=2662263 RepID=UPI0013D1E6FF|nr:flagellar biosynthesis anti-sigma factor FlgM [Paraferrimonas sp. SM1919]